MRPGRASDDRAFGASVEAFRRATARAAYGEATRARVLVAASTRARRRIVWRRTAVGVAIGVLAVLSGSAAWTALGHWRALPAAVQSVNVSAAPRRGVLVPSASRVLAAPPRQPPTQAVALRAEPARRDDGEARAYGQAHAAHFVADAPAEALGLWDAYLRRYPRGAFVPEARFNRALCLLRLGRRDEALAALCPFAEGALGGYRQREAATLIDWSTPAR